MVVEARRRARLKEAPYRRSAFTLIEILVVIAIISVLASLVLGAIFGAIKRAEIALCKNQIDSLRGALQQLYSEKSLYPRRPGTPKTPDEMFRNDIAWVYAALRNRATAGGSSTQQIEWKPDRIGYAPAGYDSPYFGSVNGASGLAPPWATPVDPADYGHVNDPTFQAAHLPGSASALVFLDPWGNPFAYREWKSLPNSLKDPLLKKGLPGDSVVVAGGATTTLPEALMPFDPEGFDIYSFGPNGIDEYGGGDDITSWGAR